MGTIILWGCIILFGVILLMSIIEMFSQPNSVQTHKRNVHGRPTTPIHKQVLYISCFDNGEDEEKDYHTYIAGAQHLTTPAQVGGFCGIIAPDKNNKYDSKAMGIYVDGLLIGYIPAKELTYYREWCDGRPMPCIGYLQQVDGKNRGNVKAVIPIDIEFVKDEFTRYGNWIESHIGEQYKPKEASLRQILILLKKGVSS